MKRVPRWVLIVIGFVAAAGIGVGATLLLTKNSRPDTSTPSESTTAPASVPTTASTPGELTCQAGRQGPCRTSGGVTLYVADPGHFAHLDELDVKLVRYATDKTIAHSYGSVARANGRYVIVRLAIRNKLHHLAQYEIIGKQPTGLVIGEDVYTEDFDAVNDVGNERYWLGKEIQPGATRDGVVVFDVPAEKTKMVKDGAVIVTDFSAEGDVSSGRVAALRFTAGTVPPDISPTSDE
jgi:hypothetical protein